MMKFQVLQDKLAKALSVASRFTSARAQLPVLNNFLIKTQKNKILICATNLETSICIPVGAQIEKEGEITIPAKVLTDLVQNLPNGVIDILVEKETVEVKTKGFSSTISAMNSSDFPQVPSGLSQKSIEIPLETIKEVLSKTLFSVSIDETRPILTGVLFKFGTSLNLVSTDGFRLSLVKTSISKKSEAFQVILPKNILLEIARLSSESEIVNFSFDKKENQFIFKTDEVVMSSRVIEGSFPDYQKIIPKENKIEFLADKEEFMRAIKLASVFARDSANIVNLKVLKGKLKLSAESATSGKQETEIDIKNTKKVTSGFEISFNYRFLEEFLGAASSDEVSLGFNEISSPGVFKDTKDKNFLHIIMPVKVQS